MKLLKASRTTLTGISGLTW